MACNEGISCKDAALYSTLENPRYPSSIRLPFAGVFFGLQQTGNADDVPPARIDHRANYANASTHDESAPVNQGALAVLIHQKEIAQSVAQ